MIRVSTSLSTPFGVSLRIVLLWCLVLGGGMHGRVGAQAGPESRRDATQQRLQNLEAQIRQNKNRLEKTVEAQETTRKRLKNVQREIALREELVNTYQRRLRQLEAERAQLRDTLQTMENRLSALREGYRDRVRHAYKYNRIPDLALLLASRSINQMLVRARYLQRFAQQRRQKRDEVRQAAEQVRSSRQQLAETRENTERLLEEARIERENLNALQEDRKETIADLRSRRSELESALEEKQSQARQLEQRIQALSAKINRNDRTAASRGPAEAANLSASFEQNRGQLRWPVEGAVTEGFGNHVDPVHETETYHPGIFIATQPAAQVRTVFEGVVSGIDFVPGYGTYLVVRHGEYLSVYSNFSSLSVTQGQTVEAGEVLGQAGTDAEPRGTGLFFAVFDRSEDASVDPVPWLTPR